MPDSVRESLEQKLLFTRRSIQFRIGRLIRNYKQRIDDRMHAENRIADLAVEIRVIAEVVSGRLFRLDLRARVHLGEPRINDWSWEPDSSEISFLSGRQIVSLIDVLHDWTTGASL